MHIADGGASTIMWRSIKPIPSKPESAQKAGIKARMTCIGQSNLCASSGYVHLSVYAPADTPSSLYPLQVIRAFIHTLQAILVLAELIYIITQKSYSRWHELPLLCSSVEVPGYHFW